jgi:hypothetical protein
MDYFLICESFLFSNFLNNHKFQEMKIKNIELIDVRGNKQFILHNQGLMDVSTYQSGVYLLKLEKFDGTISTKRFVKIL